MEKIIGFLGTPHEFEDYFKDREIVNWNKLRAEIKLYQDPYLYKLFTSIDLLRGYNLFDIIPMYGIDRHLFEYAKSRIRD